tara:strand:+ start:3669 stop:4640 length:972 start_codon:yes stop_codon:yes gene_type:complete
MGLVNSALSSLQKLAPFLTRNASKAGNYKSFVPGLTGPSARMAGRVQLPPAIANKFSTPVRPLTYPGIGTASTSTLPNVTIPKQTVSTGFTTVGQKDAAEAISKFNSKFGTNIGTPLAGLTPPLTSAAAPAAPAATGGFKKGIRNFAGYSALTGLGVDFASTLFNRGGEVDRLAKEGGIDGKYNLGLSPSKNLSAFLGLDFHNDNIQDRRKQILKTQLGSRANAAGVDLDSLAKQSNDSIKYAIQEGMRKVARRENRDDLDAAQRRQNQIQMDQLQHNLKVQELNSDIAMKGYDIQENMLARAQKEDTLKSVLALIALMKQDV